MAITNACALKELEPLDVDEPAEGVVGAAVVRRVNGNAGVEGAAGCVASA